MGYKGLRLTENREDRQQFHTYRLGHQVIRTDAAVTSSLPGKFDGQTSRKVNGNIWRLLTYKDIHWRFEWILVNAVRNYHLDLPVGENPPLSYDSF